MDKKFRGFTIIELIVVIAIIAVLATVVFISVNAYIIKARDSKRKADIAEIQKALELYYADNGLYPNVLNYGWVESYNWGGSSLETALKPYIAVLPTDPKQGPSGHAFNGVHSYGYYSSTPDASGCPNVKSWYMLVYVLENASGPDPGVFPCDGVSYRYGGSGDETRTKTVGAIHN